MTSPTRKLSLALIGLLSTGCYSMPKASDAPANPTERYQMAMRDLKRSRDEERRWNALGEAAKAAVWIGHFAEAQQYADELKSLTPKYSGSWNYGNAIHDYNTVYGFIALHAGAKQAAKRFLLASGRTPGSPQLDSFGPNMSLAKALLLVGERQAVLTYFDLCRNFWSRSELSAWRKIVASGGIPDFGANLVY